MTMNELAGTSLQLLGPVSSTVAGTGRTDELGRCALMATRLLRGMVRGQPPW